MTRGAPRSTPPLTRWRDERRNEAPSEEPDKPVVLARQERSVRSDADHRPAARHSIFALDARVYFIGELRRQLTRNSTMASKAAKLNRKRAGRKMKTGVARTDSGQISRAKVPGEAPDKVAR